MRTRRFPRRPMAENAENAKPYSHVGILGGGGWGTALAIVAAQAGRQVTLWARDLSSSKVRHARGSPLLETVAFTPERERALQAETLLLAFPAQHLRCFLVTATT